MAQSKDKQERVWERASIEAYLENVKEKLDFVLKLREMGREEEALLLCTCYIEAMGNMYFRMKSQKSFYLVLKHFGKKEIFTHIHRKMLWLGLRDAPKKILKEIVRKIGSALAGAEEKVYTAEEIISLVAPALESDELEKLKVNLWRGSFAAYVYKFLRNPNVHGLGGKGFSFDHLTFKGEPVVIDFPLLYEAMLNVFRAMKEISVSTITLLGWDIESLKESFMSDQREWDELKGN